MQMMFSIDILNTTVVDNFLILLVLKLHDFRPAGLGVIDFTSLLSTFVCALNRSEWLLRLTYLNMESCIAFYKLSKMSKITAFGGIEL